MLSFRVGVAGWEDREAVEEQAGRAKQQTDAKGHRRLPHTPKRGLGEVGGCSPKGEGKGRSTGGERERRRGKRRSLDGLLPPLPLPPTQARAG